MLFNRVISEWLCLYNLLQLLLLKCVSKFIPRLRTWQRNCSRNWKGWRRSLKSSWCSSNWSQGSSVNKFLKHFPNLHLQFPSLVKKSWAFNNLSLPSHKNFWHMILCLLAGTHQLIILNFYPYIARFLAPHQREVVFMFTNKQWG